MRPLEVSKIEDKRDLTCNILNELQNSGGDRNWFLELEHKDSWEIAAVHIA